MVLDFQKEARFEAKEWRDARALGASAEKRCGELGITVIEVPLCDILSIIGKGRVEDPMVPSPE